MTALQDASQLQLERMARQLGEEVGDTVGYRIRFESRVGPRTRIEVVTEGILGRMAWYTRTCCRPATM